MSAVISLFEAAALLERAHPARSRSAPRDGGGSGYDGPMLDRPGPAQSITIHAFAAPQRAEGEGRLRFAVRDGATRIAEFYQRGALKVRMPRVAADAPLEAVTINTAGGLTGGDRMTLAVALDSGAEAVVTGQACEKIYRAQEGVAEVATRVTLAAASRLDWLAQPMILFNRAGIRRTLDFDMSGDARLLAVEGVIFGRTAMGETVETGRLHDGWRIRRDGRLVLADALRAGPEIEGLLARPAAAGGARAVATILYCAPDAPARLDEARALAARFPGEAAASAWNGMMVLRLLAGDGQALMTGLVDFLTAFRGAPMPRSWTC